MNKLGDLLFHEGPLISHVVNQKNEDFIMTWCGADNEYNRWMLYKSTFLLLHQFFQGILTLRDLILNNPDGFVYFVDIDDNIDWKKACKINVQHIDPGFLPGKYSTYEESGFEPYALQLKTYLDYHFNRQGKLYEIKEAATLVAMEPPATTYTKKK